MSSLVLGLLGPIQATRATGEPVVFPYGKVVALLAYLAVERERAHRRESLAALLWPDQDERAARHSLSQALWNLRRVVPDVDDQSSLLLLTRDTVQIAPACSIENDVEAFEKHIQSVDVHAGMHDADRLCRSCVQHLERAVALYRGPFMQSGAQPDCVEFDEWALLIRERLHQSVCHALEQLTRHYDRHGDAGSAIAHVHRLLDLDPWREDAYRQLMVLLASTGQRAEAIAQYERCRRLLLEDLGVEPEPETTAEYLRIRTGQLIPQRRNVPAASYLPAQTTPFIGRTEEDRQLLTLIDDQQARIVTLVGPGGIGKTRLAIRAAESYRRSFRDGVFFVSLASVTDGSVLTSVIAGAVGANFQRGRDDLDQLITYVRERELLVILDNFEQLVDDPVAPRIVAQLIERTAGLTVIITSRQRLNLHAEWVVEIDGLDLPNLRESNAAAIHRSSAVQLFLTTARRAGIASLADSDLPAVARVCQLVGGLPLGIEFAAAWTPVLSVADIVSEIERSLDFLANNLHDLPDRHRSVRAIFDTSWDMLGDTEKSVFIRLSAFHGGFRREAAEQIANTSLPVLASLTGKSLVRRAPDGRYDLHELVKQYASARLRDNPNDAKIVRERHGTYYMQMLADQESRLKGPRQARALAEIQLELDNIRRAWEWAIDTSNIDAIAAAAHPLWLFVEVTGWYGEGQALFKAAIRCLESQGTISDLHSLVRARMMVAWSSHLIRTGSGTVADAIALLNQAIADLERLKAHRDLGLALNLRAPFHHAQQNYAQEQRDLRSSIQHFRTVGDQWGLAYSMNDLGMVLNISGDAVAARQLHEQSLAIFREIEDQRGVAFALTNLGVTATSTDSIEEARRYHEEALSIRRAIRYHWGIATSAIALGNIARQAGDWLQARHMLMDALRISNDIQAVPSTLRALSEIVMLLFDTGEWDPSVVARSLSAIAAHPNCDAELKARLEGFQLDAGLLSSLITDTAAVEAVDALVRGMLVGENAFALA